MFPYEENGIEKNHAVSEHELLSLLLSFALPLSDARQTSQRLLDKCSSLNAVFSQSDSIFLKKAGLNEKAIHLLKIIHNLLQVLLTPSLRTNVCIKGVEDVLAYCRHKIAFEPIEMLLVLFLDNAHKVISEDIFYKGTVDSVVIYPRDIFKHAFDTNSSSLILVHNHTSGHIVPSKQDIILTQEMIKASDVLNIAILDHLIVGPNDYVSMRSLGLMYPEESEKNVIEKY